MGNMTEFIPLSVVQRNYLPLSRPTLIRMCNNRVFKTAFKPGGGKTSGWFVHRSEVVQKHINAFPEGY
jgi:hypothetical protein